MKLVNRGDTARADEKPSLSCSKPAEPVGNAESVSIGTGDKRQETPEATEKLIEQMVERGNMFTAYKRVMSNKGAAGTDEMTCGQLMNYVTNKWAVTKVSLLEGTYEPNLVRRVEIPKPNGGVRQLGIPTVVDRLIQQALHQVLEPIFDPTFSEHSYGFRKNRGTRNAIQAGKMFVKQGRKYVVDTDISKFFDEVNHDVLMAKIEAKINDRRVIMLIRKYLQAGVLTGGLIEQRSKGTPQGGPLSPLLSNIMLDELDKELEKRGHTFCRYADDCNIYVRSKRAGIRVFHSIIGFLEKKLKLRVNIEKSAVDIVGKRKFLGYTILSGKEVKLTAAKESVKRFKVKIKETFRTKKFLDIRKLIEELNKSISGWIEYFSLSDTRSFAEELDSWIRRKLRERIWTDWKRPWTRAKRLENTGLPEEQAYKSGFNGKGSWWNAGARHMQIAFTNQTFKKMNLVSMLDRLNVAY